jgi:hypothetical protein
MNRYSLVSIVFSIAILISCDNGNRDRSQFNLKRSYIQFDNSGFDITTVDSFPLSLDIEDQKVLDSLTIYINKQPIIVQKISNHPGEPVDAEFVAFSEKSLGIFYLKSTTWRSYILLRTNNDSINRFIDILLGSLLSNSKMFLNPEQKEYLELNFSTQEKKYSH